MYVPTGAERFRRLPIMCWMLGVLVFVPCTWARPKIRDAFFAVYPNTLGTPLDTVPSHNGHCGVCHYDFSGGGTRNPYGVRLGDVIDSYPNNNNGREQAVQFIETEDSDGDGFSTLIETTDTSTFANTPTFGGLTPVNIGSVSSVDVADLQPYLVPSTGGDTTPPDVIVTAPNGGETLSANAATTIEWMATDTSGISGVDIYLSKDDGETYSPIAKGLANAGSYTWYPANRPTAQALIRVVATDNAFNTGQDVSDEVFAVESRPGGLVPTTLRDFDQPGSQPFEAGILNPPEACAACHGNYDSAVEPYFNWQGSMMAQASRDLLFEANMVIANQDAPDSGDLCLRCHLPRGWLQGRSVPTDGSQMLDTDASGVSCDFCHRLVDPIFEPQENPPEDDAILSMLSFSGTTFANGMAVIDPTGARRGPFVNAASGHPVLVSPFHREAALCGTCHDVSNPAFEKDVDGHYVPNAFDTPALDFSSHTLAPVERTYSEWFYSAYNSPGGVFAPEFGGNRDFVSTCQDCHMRDVTGKGCNFGTPPTRSDLPLHDITGGSTWLPGLLGSLFPGEVNEAALLAGIDRARYMLQNAAELVANEEGDQVRVTITNNTGHKLPTGYPEGRRMWINVRFYDLQGGLVSESGAYDLETGLLTFDPAIKVYEVKPGLDEVTAPIVGVAPGPSFHFVLNNKTFKDNRIPPRGFTNSAYASFGGQPVSHSYADGQYWDETYYDIPLGATSAEVTLKYQSTSKEFVEFLRDENTTNSKGQALYDLWNNNNKCPPEVMATTNIALAECVADTDCDDGLFCNGAETCDLGTNSCQPGSPESCDDAVECTVDTCNESSDQCAHVPNDGDCDDGLFCTGEEFCHLTEGCLSGEPVCADDCLHCDEASNSCGWCVLDLDGSGYMGTGDFALFAPCFGGCYVPGDTCLESDFDLDGCVGTGDYAAFTDCFGGACGVCAGCAGVGGVTGASSVEQPSVLIHVAVVRTPTGAEFRASPPRSVESFAPGDMAYVEVWAMQVTKNDADERGFAAVYVDLRFDPVAFTPFDTIPGAHFGVFAAQADGASRGWLRHVGGCATLGTHGLGSDGRWVRVSTVSAMIRSGGSSLIVAEAGDPLHGIAVSGAFGNVAPELIEFRSAKFFCDPKNGNRHALR